MKKQFLEIGKIVATQGIKGEVRVQYYCDSVDVICDFDTLYLNRGKEVVEIERSRPHKNVCVMKIRNIDTVEQAQLLIGKMLYLNRDDVSLDEDTVFIQDIIGLKVSDVDSGKAYGEIDDVLQNGGTDVYSIKTEDNKQLLFPAIPDIIIETDFDKGVMLIRPLVGLFEDAEEIRGE